MPKQVVLDLSQAATRESIHVQLESMMDELAYAEYRALMEEALPSTDVPDANTQTVHDGAPSQLSLAAAHSDYHARTLSDVHDVIDSWNIPSSVRDALYQVYEVLAQAEGSVHGASADQVHFHEVGKMAALQNTLGLCAAFHVLSAVPANVAANLKELAEEGRYPAEVIATPVQTGRGTVVCAHGEMSIPAPATKAIIETYAIPVQTECLDGELCTPTSAAVIAVFVQRWLTGNEQ